MDTITNRHQAVKYSSSSKNQTFYEFLQSMVHEIKGRLKYSPRFVPFNCPQHKSDPSNKDARYSYFPGTSENGFNDHGKLFCWYCDKTTHTWSQKDQTQTTPEQWALIQKNFDSANDDDEDYRKAAVKELLRVLEKSPVCVDHPYLTRKRIPSYGFKIYGLKLLIAMFDENQKIVNAERIGPKIGEKKKSWPGAIKKGRYGLIGKVTESTTIIYLCEGMATAATIHEATGEPAAISFGSQNIRASLKTIKSIWPNVKIMIIADHDSSGDAEKLVQKIGPYILSPVRSDFNDYFVQLLDKGMSRMEALQEVKNSLKVVKMDKRFYFPILNPDHKVVGHVDNLKALFEHLGFSIRLNIMKNSREITTDRQFANDNKDNNQVAYLKGVCAQYGMPRNELEGLLNVLADSHRYHPLAEYFEKIPWDGITRLQNFIETIESTNNDLRDVLIRRFMLYVVEGFYTSKGVACQFIPILKGPQGIGKTTWFKNLMPFMDDAVSHGKILDPTNKDDLQICGRYAICELSEFEATQSKKDIADLKAMITRSEDEYRVVYMPHSQKVPRRVIFCATTNAREPLNDDTGNRRWGVIDVTKINRYDPNMMAQVWAEVVHLYQSGERGDLEAGEQYLLNESNKEFQRTDALEQAILEYFDFNGYGNDEYGYKLMRGREIYEKMGCPCGVDFKNPTPSKLKNALIGLGIESKEIHRVIYYKMPRNLLDHNDI